MLLTLLLLGDSRRVFLLLKVLCKGDGGVAMKGKVGKRKTNINMFRDQTNI